MKQYEIDSGEREERTIEEREELRRLRRENKVLRQELRGILKKRGAPLARLLRQGRDPKGR